MVYYASLIYDKTTAITIRLFDPAQAKWWDGAAWTATEGNAETINLTETALSDATKSRYTATVSTWTAGYYVVEYLDGSNIIAEEAFGHNYNGPGGTPVNHDTGGTDNMRLVTPEGAGIDNATINIFLKSDYDAGNRSSGYLLASSSTDVEGRWATDAHLDAGHTYTAVFVKQGAFETATKEFTI